jgi:methionyl-tRNA formyltransferase
MTRFRLAFMGTPDFAVPVLAALIEAGHDIAAVYTQPPRKAGRGMAELPSPVQRFAETKIIPVRSPLSLKSEDEQMAFAALDLDVAIVVAYGLILPKPILSSPRLGCLNLHASLLPRWRGAAPIQRAIMAGDKETGVMVMQMEAGLDTGPVLMGERIKIEADSTSGSLHEDLSKRGAKLMTTALDALADGKLKAEPQAAEGVTYAHKIEKTEARIDWTNSAATLDAHIRGLTPFPGAYFEVPGKNAAERIKVLRAVPVAGKAAPGEILSCERGLTIACGQGALKLVEIQRAGKAPMQADECLRGMTVKKGDRLS